MITGTVCASVLSRTVKRALRILGCGGWCWHGVGACPMIEVATLQTLGRPRHVSCYLVRSGYECYRTSRVGRWSVPGAADECAQFRGGLIGSRGGLIGSRGGTIGRTGGCLGPFMRRLTPQVVAQAGRPHCHLSGPAAQERVNATSKRAHAHTSLPPSGARGRSPHKSRT